MQNANARWGSYHLRRLWIAKLLATVGLIFALALLLPGDLSADVERGVVSTLPPVIQKSLSDAKVVEVHWSPALARFVLTNHAGELFTLRGVNYNTHYTQLPMEEQLRILRRDFQQMRAAGVNVITGFATFDETTLQVAQEYGLYVIMPYVLDLSGDYLDPSFRSRAKQDFTLFIRRFENYTSLLMWNFDDEPIDNMLARLQRPSEQVAAYSDFQLQLAEYAYRTDKYHRPSWLKEPRDWHLDILESSLRRARVQAGNEPEQSTEILDPSQYAIIARSAYGTPTDVEEWLPKLGAKVEREFAMPFAVGEFGVLGVDPRERASHLAQLWNAARRVSAVGSAVYTYGPFQPHPDDPTDPAIAEQLKLVDESGVPVDDAWGELSILWLAQTAEEKDNTRRSSIPLAVPEFREMFEQLGGYPSSGPIFGDGQVKQFFVEGIADNHAIAYTLIWNPSSHQVEFSQVDRVIFNELGDFSLSGTQLKMYMENGGYARFGAPISNLYEENRDQRRLGILEFAKGLALVEDYGHVEIIP